MKRVLLFLSLVSTAALLGGCEMTQEDKEFYGRGWIHPSELDQERPTKMPAHPETTGSLGPATAAQPDPGLSSDNSVWTPPERY